MNYTEFLIDDDVYDMILNETKKIEIRLLNDETSKIKIGNIITFKVLNNENKYLNVKVNRIYLFEDIEQLWNNIDHELIIDKDTTKEDFIKLFYDVFKKNKVKGYKIVAIGFKLLKKKKK